MRLFKISLKNIKYNIKNYGMYIFSMVFCIAIFYNFMSIGSSEQLEAMRDFRTFNALVGICTFVLVIFFIAFIRYSTGFFVQQRKKEFGIYTFMGIENRKIALLFAQEGLFIGLLSLFMGTLLGIITNRMFIMAIMKISESKNAIKFEISKAAIIYTLMIFGIILLYSFFREYRALVKTDIAELVKGAKIKQDYVVKSSATRFLLGIVGVVILFAGYYVGVYYDKLNMIMMFAVVIAPILVIIGLKLVCSGFLTEIFARITKHKKIKYKGTNIVSLNSIAFSIVENNKIMSLTSILIVCCITALSAGLTMNNIFKNMKETDFPYSISCIAYDNQDEELFKRALEEDKSNVKEQVKIKYMRSLADAFSTYPGYNDISVVKYSDYERVKALKGKDIQKNMEIKEPKSGEAVFLKTPRSMGIESREKFKILGMEFKKKDMVINHIFASPDEGFGYIVSDKDYEKLSQKKLPEDIKKEISTIKSEEKFLKSLDTAKTQKDLEVTFLAANTKEFTETQKISSYIMGNGNLEFVAAEDFDYKNYTFYNLVGFISLFMAIVFIISTGAILYFKYMVGAVEDKKKFSILRKIGVGEDFVKKSVIKQTAIFFMIPYVFGIGSGIVAGQSIQKVFALESSLPISNPPTLIAIAVFTVVYFAYYVCAVRKYLVEIK